MNQELEYLREKVKKLQEAHQLSRDVMETKRGLLELMEEEQGRHKEEIRLLKNQLHSSGKKPQTPKKPELDWNHKIRFIQDYVPEYEWKSAIEELETLFKRYCLDRWEGAQKAYGKQSKGKKKEAIPANVITFPAAVK